MLRLWYDYVMLMVCYAVPCRAVSCHGMLCSGRREKESGKEVDRRLDNWQYTVFGNDLAWCNIVGICRPGYLQMLKYPVMICHFGRLLKWVFLCCSAHCTFGFMVVLPNMRNQGETLVFVWEESTLSTSSRMPSVSATPCMYVCMYVYIYI